MIAIIADDLTGANDTGVQYKKNGYSTTVKIMNDNDVSSSMFKTSDVVVCLLYTSESGRRRPRRLHNVVFP